ncbi:MAG: hypothetical protein QOH60_4219 [Mycobacterium sp.]|jgi:hypothetical protein|nr:hypothetical protein [Mycobacterium sp.]
MTDFPLLDAPRDAMGTDIATVSLAFLATRDWGARIDFDEAAGEMWAVRDSEEP